jgi:hypothetical protein
MRFTVHRARVAAVLLAWIIPGGGCASSPADTSGAAVRVEQAPVTGYMQSRVGTPDELSPVAPAEARQVRKVGDRWTCELNGRLMVFNEATGRWEPQGK